MDRLTESGEQRAMAGLIQPYLDGELPPDAASQVEAQLAADPALQALVDEQLEVRAVLQAMPPISAPQSLRARILLELDAVDRERTISVQEQAKNPSRSRWATRLRAFVRGTAVMVPAAAAAVALFFVVRGDVAEPPAAAGVDTPALASAGVARASRAEAEDGAPSAASEESLVDVESLRKDGTVPVHLAGARTPNQVHLVGLEVPEYQQSKTRGWTARAVYQTGRNGPQIIDLQQRATGQRPRGTRQMYRGKRFFVSSDRARPTVQFVVNGTLHQLSFDPNSAAPAQLGSLLELGHALATTQP